MSFLILIIGFALLIKGADVFVEGASSIAKKFNVPSMIIGLTIVAMGTSAPEAAVSVTSSLAGQNDMMAIGALDALQEARLHVPRDVSVIGCDNIFYSGIRRIALTTIEHFVALKGRDACDIIIRKIGTKDSFFSDIQPTSLYNIEYSPRVIARKTTGYAKVEKKIKKAEDKQK